MQLHEFDSAGGLQPFIFMAGHLSRLQHKKLLFQVHTFTCFENMLNDKLVDQVGTCLAALKKKHMATMVAFIDARCQ
jgi:hypothetical protein